MLKSPRSTTLRSSVLLVPTSLRSTILRSPAGTHKLYHLRSCLCSKVRGWPPWDLLLVPTSSGSTTLRSPAGTTSSRSTTLRSPAGTTSSRSTTLRSAGTHKLEVDHPEISCWYHKLEVDHSEISCWYHKLEVDHSEISCWYHKLEVDHPEICWHPQARGRPPWDLLLVPTSSRSTTRDLLLVPTSSTVLEAADVAFHVKSSRPLHHPSQIFSSLQRVKIHTYIGQIREFSSPEVGNTVLHKFQKSVFSGTRRPWISIPGCPYLTKIAVIQAILVWLTWVFTWHVFELGNPNITLRKLYNW